MWFLIHFDICELEAHTYDCLIYKQNCKVISIFFCDFDHYLDIFSESIFKASVWSMLSSIKSAFEVQNKFTSDSMLSSYKNHVCRTLFQMNKKLHLAIFVIQEKMKEICWKKNVDSVTVLLSQYLEFVNVFSKKKLTFCSHIESVILLFNWKKNFNFHLHFCIIWIMMRFRNFIIILTKIWSKNLFKSVAFMLFF